MSTASPQTSASQTSASQTSAKTASNARRDAYAERALSQLPRILSNIDRNPYSPTYGCYHRDFWLDKTSDFPDAVRQFAVHALALAYKNEMPGNIYYQQPKILEWTLAGLNFWADIQHGDGSFDEFYPYERGWVGPTAFTSYTTIEALNVLGDDVPAELRSKVEAAVRKAAHFIAGGESEEDHLANHHAMACLAVWKAYALLGDEKLKAGYESVWETFLTYHRQENQGEGQSEEGWSVEYDGIDPGYLSATVSFLAKIYQDNKDPRLLEIMRPSAEMCSYFAYPNGFYAGSLGSRNTLHFYCHGFEVIADEVPMAGAVAEHLLQGLDDGKLVPPEIISDRYLVYRVPEFLLAYLDYSERSELPELPFEREPFVEYFPGCRIYAKQTGDYYTVANLAKGGVLKVFDTAGDNTLTVNDCGIIGEAKGGKSFTSQWIDPNYAAEHSNEGFTVSGKANWVPSHKVFNLVKNLAFRGVLLLTGWSPYLAHMLKGQIRKTLMLGQRPSPVSFKRTVSFSGNEVTVEDELSLTGDITVTKLSFGDEFFVRYVPQSRYFQSQELGIVGEEASADELRQLNAAKQLIKRRVYPISRG